MKRVLFDHCVPRPFRELLRNCAVSTAFDCGWARLKNGQLLKMAEKHAFDILITSDKNLRYQQFTAGRRLAIIELPTNRLAVLRGYAPAVNRLLRAIREGEYRSL